MFVIVIAPVADETEIPEPATSEVTSPFKLRHVPPIEKQPFEMLNPTFDVDVAEALMLRPVTVVVPNPVLETTNFELTSRSPVGDVKPIPTNPELLMMNEVAVDEPTTN